MRERRGILIHPEELDESWIERLEEAHIDTLGLHPVGGAAADRSLEEAVRRHLLPENVRLREALGRRGVAVEYEAHAMAWLLPRSLFDVKPEWFRMDETGARRADFNLCASNQDALEYLAARAEQLARLLETGQERYFFWLDDGRDLRCHCPRCRELSAGDQQLLAVNAMLRGIRRYKSGASLAYLAYVDTITAPEKIAPARGVFLEYAPFDRDSHAPLFDPKSEKNAAQARSIGALLEFFGREGSQVLEYWMDNSRFSGWKKPPKELILDEDVMRGDVRAYREMGFENITSFGCYLGADYRALWGEPPVRRYGEILREGGREHAHP